MNLKVTEGGSRFTMMIRYPSWVKDGALKVEVNGKDVPYMEKPSSYVALNRKWRKGDVVRITLPMHSRIEYLPNVSNYIALLHGPVLLGAKTGTEDLKGLMANDGRWAHIASGKRLPVDKAPIIIENNVSDIVNRLEPVDGKPLTFKVSQTNMVNPGTFVLEPFFQIHDSRYMIYWMALSQQKYKAYLDSLGRVESEKLAIQNRTVDFVAPGEQQPEADHAMDNMKSRSGSFHDEFWRDASDGGHFSYQLSTEGKTGLSLMVRYWGAEWGSRKFIIYVDDKKLVDVDNTGRWNQSRFFDVTYVIPDELIRGKQNIRIKFEALPENTAGAIYFVRLLESHGPSTDR